MDIVSGIVLFSCIWWITLFTVLPIGVKQDPAPEKGIDPSAPIQSNILKKLLLTTIITIPLWFLGQWLIKINILGIE